MQTNQINIEYFFRKVYDLIFGAQGLVDPAFLAHVWLRIVVVGYVLSVVGLFVIIYCMVRLFELRKREETYYGSLVLAPEAAGGMNPRWAHIQALAEGNSPSEWREAIIEADIMLDDILTQQGHIGDGVGDKLKSTDRSEFHTLDDAWEAHKVRNQVAHEGSSFNLSEAVAHRTIARFENVFREFGAI